ncbi:MAG: 2-oxoglutarate dehydrogenase E1 component [Acidobacteria bacterium]|nr:2-oxoglutarate dehydrogenase E1 component [Acidobacteriota bacterium]
MEQKKSDQQERSIRDTDHPNNESRDLDRYSYLFNAHPQYVEYLLQLYSADPQAVQADWRHFFEGYQLAAGTPTEARPSPPPADGRITSSEPLPGVPPVLASPTEFDPREFRVINLIHGYRMRGHLFTQTNPVRTRRNYMPTLALEHFGLSEGDLNDHFQAGREIGLGRTSLREIVAHLKETYCHSIGAEYMFIRTPERINWLQERMESTRNRPSFSVEEKKNLLRKLTEAVTLENFLHSKFVGQKRFSLAGGETLVPALDVLIEQGAAVGVEEVVLGMAHRGRLNVLANIMAKPFKVIFDEFEGTSWEDDVYIGDVKYHLGYTNIIKTRSLNPLTIHLAPNPSHLEAVGPVVEGIARARIDHRYNGQLEKLIPVIIHGDAAIAGQGVVYETVQMSLLDGYRTGGTIHLVINNQLGFTTNYLDGRSSTYCTDVAKVVKSPVFHVNADDVEAVVLAVQMAMEYRQTFHSDVFIDLLGYRKYGHNEADEPRFTQPKLYKIIAAHPDPRQLYADRLVQDGTLTVNEVAAMETEVRNTLQACLEQSRREAADRSAVRDQVEPRQKDAAVDFEAELDTRVTRETLFRVGERLFTIPADTAVFNKIRRLYDARQQNLLDKELCDWAIGEALAFGTLLDEGHPIRFTGQDSERGTFSHRHAVLHVAESDEEEYVPLNQIREDQARFDIYNSLLSEYAALGFEYGYASATPHGLTVWEAQFGDFVNGAQIIIDQYIVAGEAKWNRANGLVLFLPHGFEGQGSEHSSARVERFLTMCAGNNMVLANITTPANFFHLLRRHLKLPVRIPLVVFTPKSLLRHPDCISPVADFTAGNFQPLLDDSDIRPADVRRVLLCSGKIYYELLQQRRDEGRTDVALLRLEQLYPLPVKTLRRLQARYPQAAEWRWVQEEPENMGPAGFVQRWAEFLPLQIVARRASSSPATGFPEFHREEQAKLIQKAFA